MRGHAFQETWPEGKSEDSCLPFLFLNGMLTIQVIISLGQGSDLRANLFTDNYPTFVYTINYKKVIKLMYEEYALQTFLAGGSAELLFSRMSTGTLRTAEKGNKKTALER